MGDLTTFAKRLKEARLKAGLTQAELAKKADTTAATISSYESDKGIKKASLDLAMSFAKALDVSLDWLCGLDIDGKSQKELDDENKLAALKTFLDITECDVFYSPYNDARGFIQIDVTDIGISYYIQEYKRICDVIDNIRENDIKEKARVLFNEDFDKSFTEKMEFIDSKLQYKSSENLEFYFDEQQGLISTRKPFILDETVVDGDVPF